MAFKRYDTPLALACHDLSVRQVSTLAQKIGVGYTTLAYWAAGTIRPTIDNAERLAELLDTDVDALFPQGVYDRHAWRVP